jgi:hypothetical protein
VGNTEDEVRTKTPDERGEGSEMEYKVLGSQECLQVRARRRGIFLGGRIASQPLGKMGRLQD